VAECPRHLFGRQAIPFTWDFAEGVPIGESSGAFSIFVDRFAQVLKEIGNDWCVGHTEHASATGHPLPDDSSQLLITDPPYYDMISYADLSDFFYVWLRRALGDVHSNLFSASATPKAEEIIVEPTPVEKVGIKDVNFYISQMTAAMTEARRVVTHNGIGVVVFAHKSTSGWEAQLKAMVDAGWIVTGSWPIDTEMASKVAGIGQARLLSSIHLVCRPRENANGSIQTDMA
jgi:adenine-specific DNA methylase